MNLIICQDCGTELQETSSHHWEPILQQECDRLRKALEDAHAVLVDIETAEVEEGRRNSYAAQIARNAVKSTTKALSDP